MKFNKNPSFNKVYSGKFWIKFLCAFVSPAKKRLCYCHGYKCPSLISITFLPPYIYLFSKYSCVHVGVKSLDCTQIPRQFPPSFAMTMIICFLLWMELSLEGPHAKHDSNRNIIHFIQIQLNFILDLLIYRNFDIDGVTCIIVAHISVILKGKAEIGCVLGNGLVNNPNKIVGLVKESYYFLE